MKWPLPVTMRRLGWVLAPSGLSLLLLAATQSWVLQVAGIALAGVALVAWVDFMGDVGPRWAERFPRVAEWAPPMVIVGAVAFLLPECLAGQTPFSHDHPVHLTRAWHFLERMIGRGQFSGWSDLWFAGWPSGEDYPLGADAWVTAFYLLGLGAFGWPAAYAAAVFAAWLVWGWSVYALGRAYFGRVVGLVAALLAVFDPGGGREGGLGFAIEWGVWPQTLGTAFVLLALAALERVVRRGHVLDYGLCALAVGLSIVTHPFSIVWLGVAVPIYVACRMAIPRFVHETPGITFVRPLLALGLGVGLSAFWLFPFVAKGSWMASSGDVWRPLSEQAQRIWSGTLFSGMAPPILWGAIAGGIAAFLKRKSVGMVLALVATLALLVSSRDFVERLDLGAVAKFFTRLQYQRFSYIIKPCAFLLAAYVFASVVPGLIHRPADAFSSRPEENRSAVRRYALVFLVALSLAPFVMPLGQTYASRYLTRAPLQTMTGTREWASFRQFLTWSAELRGKERDFYRIAYLDGQEDHFFAVAPVFNGTPQLRTGFTPATTFGAKHPAGDASLFRILNVKFVVSRGPSRAPHLRLERRFGSFHVYRFEPYTPRRWTLWGPGRVEVKRFDPEGAGMVVRAQGVTEDSRLVLHVSHYENWRAYHHGRRVPLRVASLDGHAGFLSLPAKAGVTQIRYERTPSNHVGVLATLSTCLVLLMWALVALGARFSGSWPQRMGRWSPVAYMATRWSRLVHQVSPFAGRIAVVALIALLAGGIALASRLRAQTLASHLPRARVSLVSGDSDRSCRWRRAGYFACAEGEWNRVGLIYRWVASRQAKLVNDGEVRRCIRARPPRGTELQIRFPRVALGKSIRGGHALIGHGRGSIANRLLMNGKEVGVVSLNRNWRWSSWEVSTETVKKKKGSLTFAIRATASDLRYCFDARTIGHP